MLEAHPAVTSYCERPALSAEAVTEPLADFWVMRDGREQWLSIDDNARELADAHDQRTASQTSQSASDVEIISRQEIECHRVWIQNWLSLLPYLATGAHLIELTLLANVVEFFDHAATMDEAEQHFSRIDPVLVRTAIITGLHGGQLVSADLITLTLSRHIRVTQFRCGQTYKRMKRSDIPEQLADCSVWPAVDTSAIDPARLPVYQKREGAIQAGRVACPPWARPGGLPTRHTVLLRFHLITGELGCARGLYKTWSDQRGYGCALCCSCAPGANICCTRSSCGPPS
jgi:hypothetical protein